MIRRLAYTILAGSLLLACSSDGTTMQTSTLSGTYVATTMRITPSGLSLIDLLASGSTMTITIDAANTTTGSLNIPASSGVGTLTGSMAGTATLSGTHVTFQQNADTFVRDLTWTLSGNTLSVSNEVAGSGTFTITLTKQ